MTQLDDLPLSRTVERAGNACRHAIDSDGQR
jgi:hypothetical protein